MIFSPLPSSIESGTVSQPLSRYQWKLYQMEARTLKYVSQSNLFMIFQVCQIHGSLNLIFQIKASDCTFLIVLTAWSAIKVEENVVIHFISYFNKPNVYICQVCKWQNIISQTKKILGNLNEYVYLYLLLFYIYHTVNVR